jgi:regulator of sigma E protease
VLPLGGYVQFQGDMNPASVPDPAAPKEEGSFQCAALWKRALIVAAGPVTNLLVAIAIFASFYAMLGKPVIEGTEDSRVIGGFAENSVAQAAGMAVGDTIIAVDGAPVTDFDQLRTAVGLHPGKAMVFTVEREGVRINVPLTTARVVLTDDFGNESAVGQIGVAAAGGKYVFEDVSILEAVPLAIRQSWDLMGMMITGIKQILVGERSVKELGGPLKIAKYSGE